MPLILSTALLALALVSSLGVRARADADFTLSAAPDPAYFTLDGPSASILDIGLTGTTTLYPGANVTLPTSGALQAGVDGIDVNYAQPYVTSTLGYPEAVSFTYGYDVTVNDLATGVSGTVLVTGTIGGMASYTGSSLLAFGFSSTPSSLDLGGDNYIISESVSSADGSPTVGTAPNVLGGYGSLVLHIADPPGGPSTVPEPSSLALMGIGGVALLSYARRRRTRS